MGHAAGLAGVAGARQQLGRLGHRQVPERFRDHVAPLQHQQPRGHVDQRHVRPVPVHEQDAAESVVDQALADIHQVLDEPLPFDRDRPREVHVVRRVAVRDRGQQQRSARAAPAPPARPAPRRSRRPCRSAGGSRGPPAWPPGSRTPGRAATRSATSGQVSSAYRWCVLSRRHSAGARSRRDFRVRR